MTRPALSSLRWITLAAALAVLVAACGTAASTRTTRPSASTSTTRPAGASPSAGPLTVSPTAGAPTTVFMLRFTMPARPAVAGTTSQRIVFELGVSGPTEGSCVGARSVAVPAAAPGGSVEIPLDPAKLGGRWCAGRYQAQVDEVVRPVCAPGMMCPQILRVLGTVGRVSFRVVSVA